MPSHCSASLELIRKRAELNQQIRAFFAGSGAIEVETPILSRAVGTDVHLDPFETRFNLGENSQSMYLMTSPEFHMKRLIAEYGVDCYQLTKAFRNGEVGRRHQPEYSILEWYRIGWDDERLWREVVELLRELEADWQEIRTWTYSELFLEFLGVDPINEPTEILAECAQTQGVPLPVDSTRDEYCDILMTHCIEPNLAGWDIAVVTDYPASQAALARLNLHDSRTARRFEVYVRGVELANGFYELTDATEQRDRFESDNRKRAEMGKTKLPLDERFLNALASGLPDCAGVALGVDRLLMVKYGINDIRQVVSFDNEIT